MPSFWHEKPSDWQCGDSDGMTQWDESILARKRALADDLKDWQRRTGGSREEFADALSVACGKTVKVAALNDWLAPSKPHRRMTVEFEQFWLKVTGSLRILHLKAGEIGARVVRSSDLPERLAEASIQEERWKRIKNKVLREMMTETAA